MIKVLLGGEDDKQVFILGVTGKNLVKLQEGMPLVITLEDLGLPNVKLALVYGATPADILKDIKDHLGVDVPIDGAEIRTITMPD
jgi:hypothetical protein